LGQLQRLTEPPAAGSAEPGSRPLWDYLAALDRRDEFMVGWDRLTAFEAVGGVPRRVLLQISRPV
jgi:hypothetical protein